MHTPDSTFEQIKRIRYKSFSFVAMVTRNNTRHKELCFILKQYSPLEEQESGTWSKTARIFIEVYASLDSETGKVSWTYLNDDMQLMATEIITDTNHRLCLHDQLTGILGKDQKMKLPFLQVPPEHLQTNEGMAELEKLGVVPALV